MADDWRTEQYLKRMRQSVTCPMCGVLVSTEEGYQIHLDWHTALNTWVQQIADNFQLIFDYITNTDNGLEKRLSTLINDASAEIDRLRTDAIGAIDETNGAVDKLRTDANTAVTAVRNDATTAITGVTNRVGVVESEVTRNPGGIWARLAALELLNRPPS